MTEFAYEIRYFRGRSWFDCRYCVYEKGRRDWYLIGGASTRWGARKVIARRMARDRTAEQYTVVETVGSSPEGSDVQEQPLPAGNRA